MTFIIVKEMYRPTWLRDHRTPGYEAYSVSKLYIV